MKTRLRVMKFGGTSVGDAACIARTAQIIAKGAAEGRCVAVVSAMSGVTNRLIEAAKSAQTGNAKEAASLIDALQAQHESALEALLEDDAEKAAVREKLRDVLAEGRRFCEGTALLRELTTRTLDAISSLGERLSAPLVAAKLRRLGVASEAVDATELIITDGFHGGAEPEMDLTRDLLPRGGGTRLLRRQGTPSEDAEAGRPGSNSRLDSEQFRAGEVGNKDNAGGPKHRRRRKSPDGHPRRDTDQRWWAGNRGIARRRGTDVLDHSRSARKCLADLAVVLAERYLLHRRLFGRAAHGRSAAEGVRPGFGASESGTHHRRSEHRHRGRSWRKHARNAGRCGAYLQLTGSGKRQHHRDCTGLIGEQYLVRHRREPSQDSVEHDPSRVWPGDRSGIKGPATGPASYFFSEPPQSAR